jgi:hypothetical protein
LASTTTYQNNKAIEKVGSLEVRPFLIVKHINVVAFQFKLLSSMRIHLMFHISLLEPYHTFIIPKSIHDPFPPIEVVGEHEY